MGPESRRRRAAGIVAAALTLGAAGPARAVVGGVEAPPGGSVMVLSSNGGVCTGVVVAEGAVLTAGHCAAPGVEHRVHFRDEAGQPVLIDLVARAVHPGYDAGAVAGRRRSIDLALLRVKSLPARFPPETLSAAMPRAGQSLTLGGYGAGRANDPRSTGTFRSVALDVVEPHGPSRILVWLRSTGAKAGGKAGGCSGDSGGPVSADGAVLAVAAWNGGTCGGLTQGVLLGPQRDWLDRTLFGWGLSAKWAG